MDIPESSDDSEVGTMNRRRVLQAAGAGLIGTTMMVGTASATKYQFYGCSQVCTDTRSGHAVVATDDGYECRPLYGEYNSDRQNQRWTWGSRCYEVSDGEAVVGILKVPPEDEDGDCVFCVNPNNCASNYYDDVDDIVDDLSCGDCGTKRDFTIGGCDVTGTGRPSGDRPGNGGRHDGGDGNGRRGKKGGNGPPHGKKGGNGRHNAGNR